jgi:hypothetical protein
MSDLVSRKIAMLGAVAQSKHCMMGKRRGRTTSFDAVEDYFGSYGSKEQEEGVFCQELTRSNAAGIRKRCRATDRSINGLCGNMITYILSYLEHHEVEYFGETCRAYRDISRQSVLWTSISLQNGRNVSVQTLCALATRTSIIHPLLDLHIYGSRKMTKVDTMINSSQMVSGADSLSSSTEVGCCESCQQLSNISPYLASLRELTLSCVSWKGISCSLQSIVSSTKTLVSLSIAHNVDVNVLVESVANSCPMLETLQFSYVNVLDFSKNATTESDLVTVPSLSQASVMSIAQSEASEEGRFDHPLLLPEMGRKLAHSCPLIKRICFRHYTIDEEGVQQILNLSQIEEVDFSDNESLHGLFLADIPLRWPKLLSLTMRDCTELEDEHISHFGSLLVIGGCPSLTYVDLSCQWAFFHTSLLDDSVREDLCRARKACFDSAYSDYCTPASMECTDLMQCLSQINARELTGAPVRWREDQCEIFGFGVDPEDGVDSVDLLSYDFYADDAEDLEEEGGLEGPLDAYLKDGDGYGGKDKGADKMQFKEGRGGLAGGEVDSEAEGDGFVQYAVVV